MTTHDQTATRIAQKYGAQYNRGPGPDIITNTMAIEVETDDTISDAFRQLRDFRGRVYIAGADQHATVLAKTETRGTDVGVMDQNGEILVESPRTN